MSSIIDMESLLPSCISLFAPTVIDVPGSIIDGNEELLIPAFGSRGFFISWIDRVEIRTPEQLFESIAVSCGFPAYFGRNWDALKDCLLDFSWIQPKPSGFLLLYRYPGLLNWSDLSEFIILVDRVRLIYSQHRKPFKVLMSH